jgi:RNA polymerase sigma-70 factor (ECF subfamily)
MSSSPAFDREIHARLVAGDPTAPACLADAYLIPLVAQLETAYPHLQDEHLLDDAAVDALFNYAQRPGSFDPAKMDLFRYLLMSARGDLNNALDKEKRRQARESPFAFVEESAGARNTFPEDTGSPADDLDLLQELRLRSVQELWEPVQDELPDPIDRRILELMLEGEKRTVVFAEILGLEDLDPKQQEKAVKRHKDRIKGRLKRLGKKIRAAGGHPNE